MDEHELWRELGQQLRVDAVARERRRARATRPRRCRRPTSPRSSSPLTSATTSTSREPGQRPARLLEGTRIAARLRPLPGRRRSPGGVSDLPPVRLAARGTPDAGAAVGGRRHRLARPGAPDRRRHGALRASGSIGCPSGLGDLRRQRDGRGVDVGGGRARRLLRARQPDRDRVDVSRLGQRGETMHGWDLSSYSDRLRAFGWHAIEIDGHDVAQIDEAYREAESTTGRPTAIVAKTIKGKGYSKLENQEGWHGKASSAEDAEERSRRWGHPEPHRGRAQARAGRAAPVRAVATGVAAL